MNAQQIIDSVNIYFGIDVTRKTRQRDFVYARMVCMRLMRDRGMTYKEIAAVFGYHHTSVMNAVDQASSAIRYGYPENVAIAYKDLSNPANLNRKTLKKMDTIDLLKIIEDLQNELKEIKARANRRTTAGGLQDVY